MNEGRYDQSAALAERHAVLKQIRDRIVAAGLLERDKPDFSFLEFARRMIGEHGHEPVPVFDALNSIGRDWFGGQSMPLIAVIAEVLAVNPTLPHPAIMERMLPYLAIGGKSFATVFLAQMGFTNKEIATEREVVGDLHWDKMQAGELTF